MIFQSTFPRGERPNFHDMNLDWLLISIHVPAWGTTIGCVATCRAGVISIHVPAWGTTGYLALAFQKNYISIHVPAWGTTVTH